jgi:hypothetical protein
MIAQRDAIVITMRRATATMATTSTMKANRLMTTLPLQLRSIATERRNTRFAV